MLDMYSDWMDTRNSRYPEYKVKKSNVLEKITSFYTK